MVYSYDSFLSEMAAKIRAMRKERGWSLRSMIADHGYHLSVWQGFENGRGMSIPSLLKLCELFDLSLEELIGGLGRSAPAIEPDEAAATDTSESSLSPSKPAVPSKAKKTSPTPSRPAKAVGLGKKTTIGKKTTNRVKKV